MAFANRILIPPCYLAAQLFHVLQQGPQYNVNDQEMGSAFATLKYFLPMQQDFRDFIPIIFLNFFSVVASFPRQPRS